MAKTLRLIQGGASTPAANPSDTGGALEPHTGERPLGPNDKVDRYIVERLIAAGGMARVYRAHHEWSKRPVALKVLRTRYAGRPELIDRFQKEAMALGQIKHANVVTLENGGLTPGGEVFIAMEFLDGKTLREVLQERGALPIREALSILSQIAHGVTAAHEAHVVHRDIKPENVFCTTFGTVKVLDLGLAKIIGLDTKATDPDGLIGTAAYMAPEQLDGQPADARSDIYALGLVAYECLAGFHPLVPDGVWPSRNEIALRQLTFEPRVLHELPPELWLVIAKAIEKNPARRYTSMEEFAAALHKVRHEVGTVRTPGPVTSTPPPAPAGASAPDPGARWLGFVRRYPTLVGAVLGLSVAVSIFAWRGRRATRDEPARNVASMALAAPAPAAASARPIVVADPGTSPSGSPSAGAPPRPVPARKQAAARAASSPRPKALMPASGL